MMKTEPNPSHGMNKFFCLCFLFCAFVHQAIAQPGRDGALTVSAANTVVNCYSAVTNNVAAGATSITVNNSGGSNCNWGCGDLIMIYQAQGASINTTNTSAYGTITNYNNAGKYEFSYVVSVSGNTLNLQAPLVNSYSTSGYIQAIKVPQYTNLTVNAGGSIVPSPWQDVGSFRLGGIVAIHATGTITVNGTIHATGFGFRPGVLENNTSAAGAGQVSLFVSTNSSDGAAKGESIAGFNEVYDVSGGRYGRGAPANGGGGGNGHNCGGGGGSNGNNGAAYNGHGVMCTACAGSASWSLDPFVVSSAGVLSTSSGGGRGGYSYGASNQNALTLGPAQAAWGGDQRDPFGGMGGYPLTATVATNRIFFGGGGGAGDRNNNANQLGGTGGGIVYLMANNVTGVGQINSNGTDALNQVATGTAGVNDAPSGGAGGGTVIVRSPAIAGTLFINARGGKGGDQGALGAESEGPGGGGGGGYVATSAGTPTINVSGGANGITLSSSLTEFTPNGATSGASGQTASVATSTLAFNPFGPLVTTSNSPVCTGQTINFTTTAVAGVTYAWSGPAAFTSSLQNPTRPGATLAMAGTYQVIYTTGGGCQDTSYTTVVVNPTPVVSGTGVNPLCNGDCNGSATVNITSGGTPAFSFLWSNGALTQTASALCAGTYNVTVTDINNCTAATSVTITNPPALSATATFAQPSCNGSCNGSITVTASGGTPPYNYSVDGGAFQASNVLNSLCAGPHVVTVRDNNNCLFNLNVNITQPAVLAVAVVTNIPSTCGAANGSLTFSASGGTTAYSFSLDGGPGQASGTFNSLAAGSHTVIVTDANGCTATTTVTVNSALAPTATVLSQQNVTCFGGSNGSVLIGAVGGTGPFLYRRVPLAFGASNLFSSLTAGTYTFEVQDNNGCIASVVVTITQPTQLTYTATPIIPASCFGVCDGTIQINPSGGTPPYEFSSNNGLSFSTTNPISGLCAGNVFVVVRDANGCLANSIVVITQPAPLNATYTPTNPLCPNVCNGQIVVSTTTGGTTPYQYSVNGGALGASNTFTGLCNGPNTILVEDANGCQLTSNHMLVDPPLFTITQTAMTESNCGFPNGSFEIVASGGAAPYNYHDVATGVNQPNGIFTNLPAGAYEIEVTDNNGCMQTFFAGINDIEMDGILDGMTDITCHGACDGTFLSHATGGIAPIIYELDGSGSFEMDGDFTGLCAGSHIVVMVDNGFCVYTLPFTLVEPDEIFFALTPTHIACNGGATGSITVNSVTGGDGVYQYSINGGPFQASNVFNGLTAGTYTITVQDGNGCTGVSTTTITEAPPLNFTVNISDLTCFNNNTGFLQIVASGGTPGYTYSFNGGPFGASFTFFPLAAGTYNFTIRDNNLCTVTSSATINQPAPLAANYTTTAPLCNGSCDGEISVNATGGTSPYMYSSNGGLSYGVNPNLLGLCAGAHNIVVKDSNGCQIGTVLNLIDPAALVFGTNITNATCGNNNGQIQVTGVSGGTGVYTYAINGSTPQASNTFSALAPDDYTITLSDDNGCSIDGIATVNDEASPTLIAAIGTNALCNASCDGSVAITASGGTGALQYNLDAGPLQASPNFTGLCAGTYDAIVTDANGCTDTTSFTLTDPALLVYAAPTVNNLDCFQDNTGSITVNTTGGTGPFLYSFDNGTTFGASSSLNFIAAGTYNIVVEDFNGCTVTGTATVTEPAQLILTGATSTTATTCFASCDGAINLAPGGGTTATPGVYVYLWDPAITPAPGVNNPNATGLCAGTYDVMVVDQNGCTIDTSFTITEPAPFEVTAIATTDVSCNTTPATCDGSVTITAPTGVSFALNGGAPQASNTFAGLCAGSYNVQVVDNIGCIANTVAIVNVPDPLTMAGAPDSLMCPNDTVPLFGFVTGGVAPYTYTWSNTPANVPTQDVSPSVNTVYTVFATDANGCISPTATTNITIIPILTGTISNDTTVCSGSEVTFTAAGANGLPAYEYEWTPTDTLPSYTVTPTAPGSYTVVITDQCADTATLTVNVAFFAQPAVNFGATGATSGCSPLVVPFMNLTPVGMIGASPCQWFIDGVPADTSCDTISLTFLDPGCHDVSLTIISPDGCSQNFEQNDMVCVFPDPVAQFTTTSDPNPPTILQSDITYVNLSTNSVSYVWTFPDGFTSFAQNPTYNFDPDTSGNYEVCMIATSPDGCLDTTCQSVFIQDVLLLYVPNAFTPDGDGVNDQFYPVLTGAEKEDYGFMIFDRWGELIFQSGTIGVGWDGTFKGTKCKTDVYVWKLKLRDKVEGVNKEYYGHVTLLR